MRTPVPLGLPLFRSEMQVRLLALLLLQPERTWSLTELRERIGAPVSSVHREIDRAERAGLVRRDDSVRPHRLAALTASPLYEPLRLLLERTVGVEEELRRALERHDVQVAAIHGSWATPGRRADSDIDLVVVGDASLRELRRSAREVGQRVGRAVDVTLFSPDEFRAHATAGHGYVRHLLDDPHVAIIGRLESLVD